MYIDRDCMYRDRVCAGTERERERNSERVCRDRERVCLCVERKRECECV